MKWSQEAANHTKIVWVRRSFDVTPAHAQGLAVLRWNRIANGAVAFINGQQVGENEPTGQEKDYLVTEAREMSLNSFRTHTQPPPRLWADIGDEHGTMILAEFPVLYNYQDYT